MAESKFGGVPAEEPKAPAEPKSQFGGVSVGELSARPSKSIAKRDSTFAEKLGATAYGMGTGTLGSLGEIEEFVTQKGDEGILGKGTVFPTVKETRQALKSVGIEEPRPELRPYQTAGELLTLGLGAPKVLRSAGKVIGTPTETVQEVATKAERLGFKLAPTQLRQDVPTPETASLFNAERNQTLANKLASRGTGKEAAEVSESFIRERIKTLGDDFDKVYKGKIFDIDPAIKGQLENILAREEELGFAGVSAVKGAAQSILANIDSGKVSGDDLQRLRNALTQTARSTASRGKAHEIYELVDVVDKAVEDRNPAMKATLAVLRPQYRNTVILEDLNASGGISGGNISLERLGNMLGGKREALRRTPQDIDELGEIGRQLRLRARWETKGESGTLSNRGLLARALSTPLRSSSARAMQRFAEKEPTGGRRIAETAGDIAATGTVVRPLEERK